MSVIENADQLRIALLDRYETLSPRLQQIGRFVLDDPHSMGVETLAVISDRVGVPPSAIVRFAKTFGFEGAGPMQRLLKDGLLASQPESVYHERVRQFSKTTENQASPGAYDLLAEFASASSLSLDHISETVSEERFEQAVRLIGEANIVYVAGFRRSFPVAAYLAYSLQQSGQRTVLVDGVGGLTRQQVGQIDKGDLIIGISFSPYAAETIQLVEAAAEVGAKIAVVTDSVVSAVAKSATCVLQIHDTQVRGFRTLAASMCVAQSLAIAHAFRSNSAAS